MARVILTAPLKADKKPSKAITTGSLELNCQPCRHQQPELSRCKVPVGTTWVTEQETGS